MSPRRSTFRNPAPYRHSALIRGLVVAIVALVIGYGVMGLLMLQRLIEGGAL
jgi:hypothetical protein